MYCYRSHVFNCCFEDTDILQGRVATHLRCGEIFIITYVLRIWQWNMFENRLIFYEVKAYETKCVCQFFCGHHVYSFAIIVCCCAFRIFILLKMEDNVLYIISGHGQEPCTYTEFTILQYRNGRQCTVYNFRSWARALHIHRIYDITISKSEK